MEVQPSVNPGLQARHFRVGAARHRLRNRRGCGREYAHLNVGQQVYGTSRGTFAQFAVAVCNKLGTRETRSKLPLEDHATLPCCRGHFARGPLKAGALWPAARNASVVITSGAGGAGIAALQQTKLWVLLVWSPLPVRSTRHHRSLGADVVVDYTQHTLWGVLPPASTWCTTFGRDCRQGDEQPEE